MRVPQALIVPVYVNYDVDSLVQREATLLSRRDMAAEG